MFYMDAFKISEDFLQTIFKDLFYHIGWSDFYERYVLVEPIWYVKLNEDTLYSCVCIEDLIYSFERPFGEIAAEIIDDEAGDFIEQALIIEQNYIFLCDNLIIFPYDRLKKFIDYLKENKDVVQEVEGLIHYHINEKELNKTDIKVLQYYSTEIYNLGKNSQLGMVISQEDPIMNFQISENLKFVNHLFDEIKTGKITITGKVFTQNKIKNADFQIID